MLMPLEKRLMLDASLPAITGQVLWLDAADKTTVRDADGDNASTGTGGSNNGFSGSVATWADKSGSGFNMTAPTAGQSPTYANTLNGNSVITFDGTNDILRNTAASIAGNDYTAFIVFQRTNAGSARSIVYEIGSGGVRNGMYYNNVAGRISYYLNAGFTTYSAPYTPGNYAILTHMQDVTAISGAINGNAQTGATGASRATTTGIYIGDDSTGGDAMQGHIAEFIIYDRDLTADERHDVETYLAGKWGLSITNAAPTITTNTGATLDQGANITITSAMLSSNDTDNSEGMLQYKITDLSDYGTLTNTNTSHTYAVGEYFTQADIAAGYIRYTHNNSANFSDSFSFTVSDQAATTTASAFTLTITPSNRAPQIQGWTLVSSENFESGATGWSDNTTETGNAYLTRFLGRHSMEGGLQNTYKTYTLSGSQDYTVITFDMYKIDSWDGEFFRVFINDSQVINLSLLQGSFQAPVDGSTGAVSYTVQELTPFAANFAYGSWNDQIFRFTLTISNSTAANIKLGFSSTLDQATNDEAWGVDNINVYEAAAGGAPGPLGIVENSSNGTVVGIITATDQDVGQAITYSIVGGTGASVFSINSTTGVITVANSASLNYEAVTSYTLQIRASDNGTPSYYDQETITINVLDLPENTAPVVGVIAPITIAENAANNTVLATATATDAESNTITWSIASGNTDNIFAINATTGAIRIANNANLNYEYASSYTLQIRATDNGFGNLVGNRNVTINITNVNEAPTFNIPQSFLNQNPYLRYNATTGNFYQYVGTAANYTTASAAASAAMLNGVAGHLATVTSAAENTYVRALGSGALWLGATDVTTEGAWIWGGTGAEGGQTFWLGDAAGSAQGGYYTNWMAANPDNSGNEDYLEMQASGQWNDSVSSATKAYVIEWEGAAVMAALGNGPFSLAENPAMNQVVGSVHARDADAGDTLTYSITGGTGAAHFAVNAATGEIRVTNPSAINYEAATSFTLDMRVEDASGLFSTQTVTINITDVNEVPVLNAAGPFSVTENASNGTLIGTMTASDPDAGATLTYSITAGDTRGVFAINNAGQITVARTNYLDYELASTYTITVRVSDGTLTASRNVTINVGNVNEAPNFDAIQRVLNSDPTLEYSAATGNFYRFVASTVNYTTAEANSASAMINGVSGYVTAIDSVAESNFVRSIIPTVIWINGSDTAVEGEWRYTSGPNAGELFWLGAAAGSAQNGNYTGWGGGEPNNSGGVEDGIEFRTNGTWNDTNPAGVRAYVIEWDGADVIAGLTNGPYNINENSAVNTVVGTAAASDPDAGDTLTYSITGGTGAGIFAINASTGQIRLAGSVNYEAVSSYTLDLRVQDASGLLEALTVTIDINDINETPVLDVNTGASLNEGAYIVITSGMLSSSDVDTPPDSLLVYTVTNQVDNGILFNTATNRSILAGQTFTQGDIDAGRIRYIHNDGETTSDSFTFTVSDGGITLPAATFNITVAAVSEAPNFNAIQALLDADSSLRYNAATGNFYKYVPYFTNFTTAQAQAGTMLLNGVGGYVAVSNSATENAYLASLINTPTWIGGSDVGVEGEWRYTGGVENGELFWMGSQTGSPQNGNYTNWGTGEPNNSGNEDNIELRTDGFWNDTNVGSIRPYIVEWDGAQVLAGTANGPYSIPENSAVSTAVGSAIARDYDAGEMLTYSITGGTGAGLFSINASTGQIRLAGAVNYEAVSSYTLDLRVQDSGGLFDTMTITIDVLDRNDVPDALNLTGDRVLENSPVGTLIGTLSTVDQDIGDAHVYALVTNPGGKFVIVGNEIYTARNIDYEQNQIFDIRISTNDGNGGILIRNFRIYVDDEMDTFTPPPSADPGAGSNYFPPEDNEIVPTVSIISSSLSDSSGSFDNFYGHQILRENLTLKISDMFGADLPSKLEEEEIVRMIMDSSLLTGQIAMPDLPENIMSVQNYTNLREAIHFLEQLSDLKDSEAKENEDVDQEMRAASLPLSAIDRQFVDVMSYHEERAARLRAALLESTG